MVSARIRGVSSAGGLAKNPDFCRWTPSPRNGHPCRPHSWSLPVQRAASLSPGSGRIREIAVSFSLVWCSGAILRFVGTYDRLTRADWRREERLRHPEGSGATGGWLLRRTLDSLASARIPGIDDDDDDDDNSDSRI
ncbi:uncharacterized protein KD926_011187 [Aspergillus affinis]|uniref:uncharacterized protein n=1 Tax=Aspergillus affinis TaxID=1070780 RepID=UPI0022FF33B7|nr:uncharacterized protein KD926_011187 [Aspergillus affinis]KAI9038248.1 hypothetical protein KD926_011187 [Aspergillus affinis]